MAHDPMRGLDPDEIADVNARLASNPDRTASANRRVIVVLLTFAIAVLPAFLGTLWVATRLVYSPLCAGSADAPVVGVDIDLPIDGGVTSDGDDGRTTCRYGDGSTAAMQDVIAPAGAIALDWATSAVALLLPFAVAIMVARIIAPRR